MRDCIKTVLKLFLIGLITTGVRIVGQLLIPAGTQTVLAPSSFAQNGTMPLAFTLYGIFAYSVFAAMFLLIRERMDGNRLWQGISYSLACCAVWVTYLWEPLPHVAAMDRITYPIADSLALIVMGLFLGRMFGKERAKAENTAANLWDLSDVGHYSRLSGRASVSVFCCRYLCILCRAAVGNSPVVSDNRVGSRLCDGMDEPLCGRRQDKAGGSPGRCVVRSGFAAF